MSNTTIARQSPEFTVQWSVMDYTFGTFRTVRGWLSPDDDGTSTYADVVTRYGSDKVLRCSLDAFKGKGDYTDS